MDYPGNNIGFDSSGWCLDLETGVYLKSDRTDATLYTNANGWLWGDPQKTPVKRWEWPVANTAPKPNSGWYSERHPTRYTWRSDVEAWARYLVDNFDCWVCTYLNHPPGWWRDETSLDVWGPAHRGDPLDATLGDEIFDLLFNYSGKPDIDWTLRNGWIWTRSGGWSWYSNDDAPDSDAGHFLHIHVTYE
jgi:hypothetical protein